MSQIEITQASQDASGLPVTVLSLAGQLDANTFLKLQQELEAIGDEGEPRVVLDCGGLEYISSAGLGVLQKMTKEFRGSDGDIRLAAVPEKIANVVNLLGFSKVIKVFGQVSEAVGSFKT